VEAEIRALYRELLGREAGAAGVTAWAPFAKTKGIDAVRAGILSSPEYRERQDRLAYEALARSISASGPKYVIVEVEPGPLRFWINLRDQFVSRGVLNGQYEPQETAFVRTNVLPGMAALDIGANIGWYTVTMATLVGPSGSVTAFEPRNDIRHYLSRTVRENRLSNVDIRDHALGAADAEAAIEWNKADVNPGGTRLATVASLAGLAESERVFQPTRIKTLDGVVGHKVDFIKIDVEGAEKLVFDGAARILREDRPLIMSEMSPWHLKEISRIGIDDYLRFLAALGYEAREIDETGAPSRRIETWGAHERPDFLTVALMPA
jgi:FkbM family methyltransferase